MGWSYSHLEIRGLGPGEREGPIASLLWKVQWGKLVEKGMGNGYIRFWVTEKGD